MGFYTTTSVTEKPHPETPSCGQKTASGKFFTYPIKTQHKNRHNSLITNQEKPLSTHETASGVFYYKYRHYSAELGRWPSRDPIEEDGGVNLYGFVGNEPMTRWDRLGLLEKDLRGINCLGYACGSITSIIPDIEAKDSLEDVATELGFTCKLTSKKCNCPCKQKAMIIYIYLHEDFRPGSKPFSDPWIRSPGKNDYHAIGRNADGTWSYVAQAAKFGTPKAKPKLTSDPFNPDSFWLKPDRIGGIPGLRYCCCKDNDDTIKPLTEHLSLEQPSSPYFKKLSLDPLRASELFDEFHSDKTLDLLYSSEYEYPFYIPFINQPYPSIF